LYTPSSSLDVWLIIKSFVDIGVGDFEDVYQEDFCDQGERISHGYILVITFYAISNLSVKHAWFIRTHMKCFTNIVKNSIFCINEVIEKECCIVWVL